jgi:glycosidase
MTALRRLAPLLVALACAHSQPQVGAPPPAQTAAQPGAAAPASAASPREWARGAVFYEVFVRSFQDSDGDGVGDLRGLVARLDHLNDGDPATTSDLEVDAIWLMPIFASPSYHGYDTVDYERIQPAYGTLADLDRLVAEAHRRGIRVVLDLVLNHTSDEHPWFRESSGSRQSPRRDWYVWRDDNPRWPQPWNAQAETWHAARGAYYYGLFWSGMPDLNLRNAAVRAEAKRIASFWLARGVDGFRLDAIRHLVETGPGAGQSDTAETHAFLKELAAHVRAQRPDAILVGEAWTETPVIAAYHGAGDELDVTFDFPLAARLVEGLRRGDATGIAAKLREVARTYPPGAVDAPFLTNHDMRRVASELGGRPELLASAAAVLLTLPGAPFLYYGEEIGLANGSASNDEAKRTPMRWDGSAGGGFTAGRPWFAPSPADASGNVAAQTGDPGSLLSHYRRLIRARHASEALARGSLTLLESSPTVLAFVRETPRERVLVVHNMGEEPATFDHPAAGTRNQPFVELLSATFGAHGEGTRIFLPPHASFAIRTR